jgi:hypothetical protein
MSNTQQIGRECPNANRTICCVTIYQPKRTTHICYQQLEGKWVQYKRVVSVH